jgi:hypothetical protein
MSVFQTTLRNEAASFEIASVESFTFEHLERKQSSTSLLLLARAAPDVPERCSVFLVDAANVFAFLRKGLLRRGLHGVMLQRVEQGLDRCDVRPGFGH